AGTYSPGEVRRHALPRARPLVGPVTPRGSTGTGTTIPSRVTCSSMRPASGNFATRDARCAQGPHAPTEMVEFGPDLDHSGWCVTNPEIRLGGRRRARRGSWRPTWRRRSP